MEKWKVNDENASKIKNRGNPEMTKRRLPAQKRKPVKNRSRLVSARGSGNSSAPRIRNAHVQDSQRDQTESSPSPQAKFFRIEGKPTRYRFMAGMIILIGIFSIYFYVDVLLLLRNFYTLLFVIPLYVYVFGGLIVWVWSGVRAVEVDPSGLRIIRSSRQPVKFIGINEIGSIRVTSTLDGKMVDILLHGATSRKFLWMYFNSGPCVHIPQGPFDKKDFAEFIQQVASLVPVPHQL
jgi:hypothetical protein